MVYTIDFWRKNMFQLFFTDFFFVEKISRLFLMKIRDFRFLMMDPILLKNHQKKSENFFRWKKFRRKKKVGKFFSSKINSIYPRLKHTQRRASNSLSKWSNEVHILIFRDFRDFRQKVSILETLFDTIALISSYQLQISTHVYSRLCNSLRVGTVWSKMRLRRET